MPRVPSPAAKHIGRQIRAARRAADLTPESLGHATGIDSSNIRAYETGRAMPSVHSLLRIALALDTSPGELLDGLTLDLFGPERTDRNAG